MRTIKFRGKSIDSNEWLYGVLVHPSDMERCAILVNDRESCDECEVDPCSIGQFTCLCDSSGKEIYEGDIIRWYVNNLLYVVTFESGMFYASIKECNEGMLGGFPLHQLTEYDYGKCEIVGNIHDNPELLKGGNE